MVELLKLPFVIGRRTALPLDPGAFRLFLAMLVFVHHFSSFAVGAYAVYVFFMLSGYWLHRMWWERYSTTRQPYVTYLISRVWRLGPTMALVSVITIMLLPLVGIPMAKVLSGNPLHLLVSSTLLLGYTWLPYLPVGSAWSLDVEMQFYLIAPAIATLLAQKKWRWPVIMAAALCSLAYGMLAPHAVPVVPKYIVFFVLGMASAALDWRPSRRLALACGIGVAAAVLLMLLSPWRGIILGGATPGPLFAYNFQLNIALALATLPLAIYTTGNPSDATDRMMADLSYIVYLLHWVAMQWFFSIKGPFIVRLEVAAISFAVVPTVAWLIWKFYDKPINRARSRWVASRTPDHSISAPMAEPAAP